ncbi:MAG: hypothetical protein KDA63_00695 [Planctomycetales bacterium]|nr:hypothetical protein [Planctomycetales bacterium]
MTTPRTWLFVFAVLALVSRAVTAADELPLILEETFSDGAERWQPADKNGWKVETVDGKHLYRLVDRNEHEPPHRSPYNISILADVEVSDFELTAHVRSTGRDYGHRDVCLLFGYQDPGNYYYVHFGKKTDDHANQIFIVNDAPRVKISTKTTPGTPWDDEWHTLRVTRDVDSGAIAVYFDDMDEPVMTATDKTFTSGRIGIGSFDDTADFERITLRGNTVATDAVKANH